MAPPVRTGEVRPLVFESVFPYDDGDIRRSWSGHGRQVVPIAVFSSSAHHRNIQRRPKSQTLVKVTDNRKSGTSNAYNTTVRGVIIHT